MRNEALDINPGLSTEGEDILATSSCASDTMSPIQCGGTEGTSDVPYSFRSSYLMSGAVRLRDYYDYNVTTHTLKSSSAQYIVDTFRFTRLADYNEDHDLDYTLWYSDFGIDSLFDLYNPSGPQCGTEKTQILLGLARYLTCSDKDVQLDVNHTVPLVDGVCLQMHLYATDFVDLADPFDEHGMPKLKYLQPFCDGLRDLVGKLHDLNLKVGLSEMDVEVKYPYEAVPTDACSFMLERIPIWDSFYHDYFPSHFDVPADTDDSTLNWIQGQIYKAVITTATEASVEMGNSFPDITQFSSTKEPDSKYTPPP